MMMIFIQGRPQLLCYMVPMTVTSTRDHLKHKVIPTDGLHGKEIVGSEEGEGSATDMMCESSGKFM